MTLNEYAKALKRAPEEYRKLEWGELQCALYRGRIILTHPSLLPIIWHKKKWEILTAEGDGPLPSPVIKTTNNYFTIGETR